MPLPRNQPPNPAPTPSPNPIPYNPMDAFTITIINLYGRRYEFSVTPRTLMGTLYLMMQRESGIPPQQMVFVVPSRYNQTENNVRMPRLEDEGVARPLRDFNMFQDITIRLLLRLGPSSGSPYRREDWFPLAELEEAQRQMEILDIDDDGDEQTYMPRRVALHIGLPIGLPTHLGQPRIF